jgi:hypothetical protein
MKNEKKDNGVLALRQGIVTLAKHRLENFFEKINHPVAKKVQRWEAKMQKERDRLIKEETKKQHDQLLDELNKVASVKPYHRSELSSPLPPQKQEQQEQKHGNWMKSDGFGTLLEDWGGSREEDPLERPANVRILYGGYRG